MEENDSTGAPAVGAEAKLKEDAPREEGESGVNLSPSEEAGGDGNGVDMENGVINLTVRLPAGETLRIPLVQTLETVSNVKQLILDIPEFSHISCCHLEAVPPNTDHAARKRSKKSGRGHGVVLNEYNMLSDYKELMEGYHIKVVQDTYNHQAIIDHVKRLEHILKHPPTPLLDEQREFEEESEPEKEDARFSAASNPSGSGSASSGGSGEEGAKESDGIVEEKKYEDESLLLERKLNNDIQKHQQMQHSEVYQRLRNVKIPLQADLSSFYPGKPQRDAGIDVNTCSGMQRKGDREALGYPKCLSKLRFSAWNPPPPERTMMGDLAYLEVCTTGEPELVYNITATASGFFINATRNDKFNPEPSHYACTSATLLELLQRASPSFRKDFSALIKRAADLARQVAATTALSEYDLATLGNVVTEPTMDVQGLLPRQWNVEIPENGRVHEQDYSTSSGFVQDAFGTDRMYVRDWNEEYQASIEMPSSTNHEKILRCRAIDRVHKDFVDCATKAAMGIMRGHIPPMNPADPSHAHVFVYNQIFFSLAKPEPTIAPDVSGKPNKQKLRAEESSVEPEDESARSVEAAVASYSVSNHDLLGVRSLNESMELLRVQANMRAAEAAKEEEQAGSDAGEKAPEGIKVEEMEGGGTEAEHSLKTLMTAVVDYMGQRIIAQSIIPGILHSDHHKSLVHGSVDYGKTMVSRPEVEALWEQAMAPWFVCRSEIKPESSEEFQEIVGPVESKAIHGSDGRIYALDLLRFTPFDLNYYKQRSSFFTTDDEAEIVVPVGSSNAYVALLRPELVRHFARWRESKHQQRAIEAYKLRAQLKKQKEASGEVEKGVEEEEKLTLEPMEPIQLDLNAHTAYAQKETEQLVASKDVMSELATFLLEAKLPALLEEIRRNTVSVSDGQSLTNAMHSSGINLRYLGRLATGALEAEKYITKGDNLVVPPAYPAVFELCEVEMVSRCIKWVLRENFRSRDATSEAPAVLISSILNELYGNAPGDLWSKINKRMAEHYSYIPMIWGPKATFSSRRYPLVLLRRVCQVCGIQMVSRKYIFNTDNSTSASAPFKPEDVIDMVPVVKSSIPDWPILEAKDRLESAKLCLAGKEPILAYKRANEALTLVTEVAGPAHPAVIKCCVFTATILHHLNDPASALLSQRRALALLERMGKLDTTQVAQVYSNVGMLLHAVGQSDAAIPHIRRSIYLMELMGGPYVAEVSTLYLKMANIYVQAGKYDPALLAVNEALIRAHNDQLQQAVCRCQCAHIFAVGKQKYEDAFKQEKIAYDIYKQLLGPDHIRTVDVTKWMQVFMKRNIEIKLLEQKTRDLEEQQSEAKKEIKAKKAVKKAKKKRK